MHARYVEDAVAFGVTDSIYSSVLNLLIQELTSGKRMIGLTHHELLTVASTLSKVADQEYSEPAWSAMMRETSRILMEDLEAAVSSDASLTHAIVVVLKCFSALTLKNQLSQQLSGIGYEDNCACVGLVVHYLGSVSDRVCVRRFS